MFKLSLKTIFATWLTGLLALLPLTLTLVLLAWIISVLDRLIGPSTLAGQISAGLGQYFVSNPSLAYLFGGFVLLACLYPLGLAVQLGLRGPLTRLIDVTLRRTPLIGQLYNLADRFVALLDKDKNPDIGAMSPVWCFFGGDGTAVLALLPSPTPIEIEGRSYHAILVPTAPIPIGGGLLYVPVEWVRPAHMGIDELTSIYVSMGLTPPSKARTRRDQSLDLDHGKGF
ncbi:DUF502 domain-containing protein [Azotobacter chroococcum]|uniref:DUF502 domain-containing protein n=1 Tax=Azotobacter chroococcum TaxID=353 RepID=A0AA43Z8M8_9GAMM|nr:DUF502 domain-containing protein [Azotobacter chroococcum]NHN78705.1 DUF502 domain-containing protein [Azotobacter chroococcum]TBW10141.1 DUF502 domain-containing protein [Azotobacter chroococcum subsp. isscasi]